MLFDPGQPVGLSPSRLLRSGKADPNEVALNNELNWFFSPKEMTGVLRYRRGKQVRDLLFLRPEAYEPFLSLMRVTKEAKAMGIRRHCDRFIGYFTADRDDCPNGRIVLVLNTYLGENPPQDEEDLLDIT